MDCLTTIKNLKLNKNKAVGDVLIIVEGTSDEYYLLKYILVNVLDYTYIPIRKNKIVTEIYESKTNINSKFIIANTSNSNIKSLNNSDYQDRLYSLIMKECHKSLKDVSTFILWDRDNKSNNDIEVIKALLEKFKNSLDNDYDMNGLLLISYPCLEAYVISNFVNKKNLIFKTSLEAKEYSKDLNIKNISERTLIKALTYMHKRFREYNIFSYDPSSFLNINKKIFNKETEYYKNFKAFLALSLISVMFVDLGIIVEK